MTRFTWLAASVAALAALTTSSTTSGQVPAEFSAMQAGLAVASLPRDATESPLGRAAAPGQFHGPGLAAAPAARTLPPTKPFQWARQRPTISPYLNLYREERDESLPNYYAFVLPQMRQQEFFDQQQADLAQMQQQLQQVARQSRAPAPSTEQPPQSYHARFLNTGSYFSGVPVPRPGEGGQ